MPPSSSSSPHLPNESFSHVPFIPSSPVSSATQLVPTNTNLHPMATRSKHGIVKPKISFNLNTVGIDLPLPAKEPNHFS